MIQIPEFLKPPTDNIYKFLAISGLILLIVSFVIPYVLNRDLAIEEIQTEGDSNMLTHEIEDLEHDVTRAETTTPTKEQVQSLRDRLRQIRSKNDELKTKTSLLRYYDDELNNLQMFKWINSKFL